MIKNNILFGSIKKAFIGLLNVCTKVIFSDSLHYNLKEPIKCVTIN